MKKIGIWIDKEKAHIVTLSNDKEHFRTLESEVEDFHIHGGSRSKTRWGPQDVVQDSKYLEREKHQLKAYFKKLAELIKAADVISVFGPGEAKDKFRKEMNEKYPQLAAKIKTVQTADSMTDNQIIALVKENFI
jgi:stalled ribosome rescue protein Dom34